MKKSFSFYALCFVLSWFIARSTAASSATISADNTQARSEIAEAFSAFLSCEAPTDTDRRVFAAALLRHRKLLSSDTMLRECIINESNKSTSHKFARNVLEQCKILAAWEREPYLNQFKCTAMLKLEKARLPDTEHERQVAELDAKSEMVKTDIDRAIAEHIEAALTADARYVKVVARRPTPIIQTPPFGPGRTATSVSPLLLDKESGDSENGYPTSGGDSRASSASLSSVHRNVSPAAASYSMMPSDSKPSFGYGRFVSFNKNTPPFETE